MAAHAFCCPQERAAAAATDETTAAQQGRGVRLQLHVSPTGHVQAHVSPAEPPPAPDSGAPANRGSAEPPAVQLRLRVSGDGRVSVTAVPAAQRPLGRIIIRTLYFDRVVTGNAAPGCQVVLLGSGMDTRPWRLALPPRVAWFEVDQADVLRAKQALMSKRGAAFRAARQGYGGDGAAQHPLRAASWSGVTADLQQPGWSKRLQVRLHGQCPRLAVALTAAAAAAATW